MLSLQSSVDIRQSSLRWQGQKRSATSRGDSDHAVLLVRPASTAACAITRSALHPAARRSRTPVSPSDLLEFLRCGLHDEPMVHEEGRNIPTDEAASRICRPVDASRSCL